MDSPGAADRAVHDRQLGLRHHPRQVVDAATVDVEGLRLLADRQIVRAVNNRFAVSNPALLTLLLKNRFPMSVLRSWRAAPSRPRLALRLCRRQDRKHLSPSLAVIGRFVANSD
jgi:hypothetical protein